MAQYDAFAAFYNRAWGAQYHEQVLGVLDRLLLRDLAPGDSILDVGCGSGQVAAQLIARGFRVTGVDESAAMLEFARVNAPQAIFLQGDARHTRVAPPRTASIATFEALNHILDSEGLQSALSAMAASTERVCVFDLLQETAYDVFWNGATEVEQGGDVCRMQSHFDVATGIASCRVSVDGSETTITERFHDLDLVESVLRDPIGYREVRRFEALRDLGMTGDAALGRVFFQCSK